MPANAQESIKGDINGDGEVTMEDVEQLKSLILSSTETVWDWGNDVTGDGCVTVTDITTIINQLKGGLDVDINGWDDSGEDYGGVVTSSGIRLSAASNSESTYELAIAIDSDVEINGFELTIEIPNNAELVESSSGVYGELCSRSNKSHVLYNSSVDGRCIKFLAYSTSNALFSDTSGDIMKFKVKSTNSNFNVNVLNVWLSDKDCNAIRCNDFKVSGIEDVTIDDSDSIVDVYSINGAKVKSQTTITDATKGLPSGIYIINNKKVFVK